MWPGQKLSGQKLDLNPDDEDARDDLPNAGDHARGWEADGAEDTERHCSWNDQRDLIQRADFFFFPRRKRFAASRRCTLSKMANFAIQFKLDFFPIYDGVPEQNRINLNINCLD